MIKPKLCKWEQEPCTEERTCYPGKSIRAPYCQYHLALSHIYKKRAEATKDKEELDKARKTLKKGTPRKQFYSSTAWKHFSQYVLLKYADENLVVRCSTNPSLEYRITDKRICVGHFIKVFDGNSSNYSTAFLFINVGPQSTQENNNGGNELEMSKWIEKTHGAGTVAFLNNEKHKPLKLDKYTLDQIAKTYLALKNEELKRRGINNPWKSKRY